MATDETGIGQWLSTPLGESLVATERAVLEELAAQFFGFHMVQIGEWGDLESVRSKALTRQTALISARPRPAAQLVSRASQLAIASDSVDAVILPHTLEFDPDPHQVLREAERVLTGEGKIVIVGFNPWSLWGARRLLRSRRYLPGLKHMISRRRLRDWLSLLGFEFLEIRHLYFRPPMNSRALLERTRGLETVGRRAGRLLSGVYVVMAKKCVYSALPPRVVRLRSKKAVMGGGLVEPTQRNGR